MKKLVTILITIFVFSCSSPDYYAQAKKDFHNGKIKEAKSRLQKIEINNDNFDSAKIMIGLCDSLIIIENHIAFVEDSLYNLRKKEIFDSIAIVRKYEATKEFMSVINSNIDEVKRFSTYNYRTTVENMQLELLFFSDVAEIIKKGKLSSNKEVVRLTSKLENSLKDLQWKEFPKLRKSYIEILDKKLWENNIDVFCKGKRNTTMEFVGGLFADNKNKKEFQETIFEIVKDFRFKKVSYKWYEYDDDYTYYTIYSLSDGEFRIY